MYADVVVLTHQPPDIPAYTYKIPKKLEDQIKTGQLVSVPFGKRNPIGIVIDIRPPQPVIPAKAGIQNNKNWILDQVENDKKEVVIKPVSSIVFPTPLLLPYQIELAQWMSFYYHAPMVNCLEAIIPELPRKLLMVNSKWKESIHHSPFTIHQTLVLVPTINRIPETLARYPQAKNYVIYHNELKIREKFATWLKILTGTVDYIFGSRSAIFTPCSNLAKIVIFDEHESAYKDERSPYYDTLTVAEKISEFTGCKIEIVDTSPRITTYFNHKQNVILEPSAALEGKLRNRIPNRFYRGFQPLQNDKNTKVQIISMLAEKAAGNRSPISDQLETYLKLGFKKNKRILLFLNKKKESGHVYCRSCKFSDFANVQPEICPNCNSADIYFNTLNINSLATLIKKIVPNAGVNILTEGKQSTINDQQLTIDIATSSVFYKLSPQKYDLVAAIATDSLLNITDFTAFERLYTQISDLKKLARGLLALQTYNPDHSVIKNAAAGNYQQFFREQLRERKALSYPPFAQLIKLTIKGKKEEDLQKKSQELFDDLMHSPFTINHSLSILGPYRSTASTATVRYNIIAKIPVSSYSLAQREKAVDKARPLLAKVPRNWQIETEPDSL